MIIMLDKKTNDKLARVGKDTPCGKLLRRYWHPICFSSDIKEVGDTKQVRLLGEDLALIRLKDGSLFLSQRHCPHRGASLVYSFVEGEHIRCPYHGWLFNKQGQCIEKPFESKKSNSLCRKLIDTYSTHEIAGLVFAYLGPEYHKPYFPMWDILVREDGVRHFEVQDDLKCNWLQMQENAVDVTHTHFLHSKYFEKLGMKDTSGFGEPFKKFGFQPFQWGIVKSWYYAGKDKGVGWGNPLIFPNMLRLLTEMHWRVPIDDETTRIVWVSFTPNELTDNTAKNIYPEVKQQPRTKDVDGRYLMDTFMSQDAMAAETQGAFFDRSKEQLGASDTGIVMLRKILQEQIAIVENNGNPIANVYDSPVDITDLRDWMGGYLPMSCAPDPTFIQRKDFEEIFVESHIEYQIPDSSSVMKKQPFIRIS